MINQFIFLLVFVLLGLSVTCLFRKKIKKFFVFILSLPVGLSFWGLIILFFLIIGIPANRYVVLILNIFITITFFFIGWRRQRLSKREIRDVVIFLLVYSSVIFIFLKLNFSILTNDSWNLFIGGEYITSFTEMPDRFLAIYGIFQYTIMASGSIYGFDYLYALSPLMILSLSLILWENAYFFFRERQLRFDVRVLFSLVIVLFPLSGFLVSVGVFYISSNISTAFFAFFSLFGIWKRCESGKRLWTLFSALMLVPVGLMRPEGSLFILINIIIFISLSEVQYKEKMLYSFGVLVPISLWFLKLAINLTSYTDPQSNYLYSSDRLMLILFLYMLLLFYMTFLHKKLPQKLVDTFPIIMLYVLAIGWTYFLFYRGLTMKLGLLIVQNYGNFIVNLLKDGYWGGLWIALGILFLLSLCIKKIKHESIFLYYIFSFVFLYNIVHLFRKGWRIGWGDSGNRMLFHILFIVCFYVFLKFLNFLFPKKEAN